MNQTASSTIQAIIPVVPALNIEQSLAFYQEHFGFSQPFTWGNPAEYGGFENTQPALHFYLCHEPSIPENYMLRLAVQDIETLYARCQTAGIVHPNGPLENKPWGYREFSVLDPAGVCINLYSEI